MKVVINQTINKVEIKSKGKIEIKDNVMPVEIYKCKVVEGGELPILQGFDTMDAATLALGLGKLFYYNAANLEGATAGSIHITI
jgi:hypothetical protein